MITSSNGKTYVQEPQGNWSTYEPIWFDQVAGILAENNPLTCEACPITFRIGRSKSNVY